MRERPRGGSDMVRTGLKTKLQEMLPHRNG
jgi:hypothetical protein